MQEKNGLKIALRIIVEHAAITRTTGKSPSKYVLADHIGVSENFVDRTIATAKAEYLLDQKGNLITEHKE